MLSHKNTILAAWQAAGAIFLPETFLVKIIFHRKVADT
jgi:hypothetical protein